MATKQIFYVDIPTDDTSPDAAWKNLGTFDTKAAALAYIRENIGDCDDNGNVSLLTEGTAEIPID